jgi:hypothetical protein
MKKFTMEAKTVEPTTYSIWAIDRATKEEVEFQVQAFTTKQALDIARTTYKEENPDGCRIRVCIEETKFDKAKTEWVERLETNRIKNNARNIGKVVELAEVINDETILDKVLEIVDLTEFKEYAEI